ncbi:MAG: response regulator [Armatimonadota bacterium]
MATSACILVVEHNPYNLELLSTVLEQQGYAVLGVTTLEASDHALAQVPSIHLALVDIEGFDRSIWDRCEAMHQRGIPLLVLAPGTETIGRHESYQHGASGVLAKPLITEELITVIGKLMESTA